LIAYVRKLEKNINEKDNIINDLNRSLLENEVNRLTCVISNNKKKIAEWDNYINLQKKKVKLYNEYQRKSIIFNKLMLKKKL